MSDQIVQTLGDIQKVLSKLVQDNDALRQENAEIKQSLSQLYTTIGMKALMKP